MIPNSVTTIGNFVFSGSYNLISLLIPESVTSIGWDAFSFCSSLEEIDVAFSNQNYTSENGVLFSKDKTTLLCYPQGKTDSSYSVPQGVIEISAWAFKFNDDIVSVSIPEGVTKIGANAFFCCDKLESVFVPTTVTYIGSAFSDCASLESITFDGTKDQWESIEKDGFSDDHITIIYTVEN